MSGPAGLLWVEKILHATLVERGFAAVALSGEHSQNERNQALQALRFFQGVQVFALNVFNQRHGRRGLVGHIAHQHRCRVQTG